MNDKQINNSQVRIERFHFSVRLKSIFFPLELNELKTILDEIGYSFREELTKRLPELPYGGRVIVSGVIGDKKDTGQTIRLDAERGILAIVGKDIEQVIVDLSNLEKLAIEKVNVNLESEALFYEFIAEGSAITGRDPTKVIAKIFNDSKLESEISKTLGFSTTNFGVRIVEKDRYVSGLQWFDLKIEPLVPKPNAGYTINLIYRHPNRSEVVNTAKSLTETVEKILAIMERGE